MPMTVTQDAAIPQGGQDPGIHHEPTTTFPYSLLEFSAWS